MVYAGFIAPGKGLDTLVAAWEQVGKDTDLRLVIVGDVARQHAEYAEQLRARLEDSDSPVSWHGWTDDDAFHATIADSAIVVLPYRQSNPVSGILIRAAVEGRAIIGTRVPAVVDFIEDRVSGLIVQPDDPHELAGALVQLAADKTAMDELGAGAASRAARCTWPTQVDRLLEAYDI